MVGFNASAFHMDIENLQLNVTAGSCSSRLVFNVPKSVSQGAEVELNVVPNQFFDFAVSGTFTNSELRSTFEAPGAGGQMFVVSGIEEGNRLPSVPKVQANAAATFRWPMQNGAQGFVTGSFSHVGSRYTQIDDHVEGIGKVNLNSFGANTIGGPLTASVFEFDPELPSYNLANFRVGMTRANWDLAAFVNNVTDERALLALDRERGLRARVGYLTNQPRTFGLTLGFHY
jgi:iron complex outermembrane recepter protein